MALANQEEFVEEQEDTQHGRFLTFVLGEEVFGIEIRYVKEIIGIQPITRLPEAPESLKGIVNLRGKIIPVIDVRLKFKKSAQEYNDRTCIIVIETNEITAGLIVDNVAEVIAIDDENIVPPPDMRAGIQNRFISGIGKVGNEVKLLLDCESLFKESEFQMMNDLANEK
jgi:purine-binding chemotaxis protein CheW